MPGGCGGVRGRRGRLNKGKTLKGRSMDERDSMAGEATERGESTHLPARVLLVEDVPAFREALAGVIEAMADFSVVATAETLSAGHGCVAEGGFDLLLLDLGLPDGSGIDLIHATRGRWPSVDILVLSALEDERHILDAIEAGATGYLLKDAPMEQLEEQLRQLRAGGSPLSPRVARKLLARLQPFVQESGGRRASAGEGGEGGLAPREREVLECFMLGMTQQEIALHLGVSVHTVATYVRRLYRKLDARSRSSAIAEARSRGLLDRQPGG